MTDSASHQDADKTQALPLSGDTADIPVVSDETVQMDALGTGDNVAEPGDTRSFPATVANDAQAKDMTVMLDESFAQYVGVGEENTQVAFKTGRHSKLPSDALVDAALVPSGKTDILPLTPKYFEQFESDEMPEDALDPKTPEPSLPAQAVPDVPAASTRRKRTIIIVLCVVVMLALLGTLAWIMHARSVHDAEMKPHAITMQVSAQGYDANDSKIPLHIEGIDMDGNYVDTIAFVGPDGTGMQLVRGSYTVEVAASPLLDSAELYKVDDTQIRIDIPDSIESGAPFAVDSSKIELSVAAMTDITNSDIALSYDYAIKSGFDSAKADEYRAALTAKRDSEVSVKQAAEEKAQRQTLARTALTAQAKSCGTTGVTSKIIDIDGDDIPEMLLAGNADSSVGAMCFVYGYDVLSHDVTVLCSAAGGSNYTPSIWYSTSAHEVVLTTSSSSGDTYTLYSVGSGAATTEHVYARTSSKSSQNASSSTSSNQSSSASSVAASSSTNLKSTDIYLLDGQPITPQDYADFVASLNSSYEAVWSPPR